MTALDGSRFDQLTQQTFVRSVDLLRALACRFSEGELLFAIGTQQQECGSSADQGER